MAPVRIRPEAEIRATARSAFERHRQSVRGVLPDARVEHVGSTSIPGALTKGDVDLLVSVERDQFDVAAAKLRRVYEVHQPENWTPTYASFADSHATDPPVGVQLVAAGSADASKFGRFQEALISDPARLAEYNALKLRHDGDEYESYTAVKRSFIERVLAES